MNLIAIDLQKESFLPGQFVKGSVNIILDKHISARAVTLDIVGLEKTKVVVGSGEYSHAYNKKNYILKKKIYLYPPQAGMDHEFAPGHYANKIEFKIPPSAPPSYEGENVEIKYWLKTRVDIILWRDLVKTKSFNVYRKRKDLDSFVHPANFESSNFTNLEADKPGFYVELPRKAFKAGKSVEGEITICNKDVCKIRKIDLRLIGTEHAKAKGHEGSGVVRIYESELSADDLIEGKPVGFKIPIPKGAPVSYTSENSGLSWALEVQLDLPLKFDIKAQGPVEIIR
jgi:hypothetical protein